MMTQIKPITSQSLAQATRIIREGGVVAFGTETVYGLGANAYDEAAVRRIFEAKGRPSDNPLIVHLASVERIPEVAQIDEELLNALRGVMPAPLTVILDKLPTVPDAVTAGLNTVGVRVPDNEGARAFLEAVGTPIAAPSANTSSRPSPTTAGHVYEDLQGKIELILDTGACDVGVESTVVRVSEGRAIVYRPGGMSPEHLQQIFGEVVYPTDAPTEKPLSPGMKYRHYAPSVPVRLVAYGDVAEARRLYGEEVAQGKNPVVLATEDILAQFADCNTVSLGRTAEDVAKALFYELRESEKKYGAIVTFEVADGGLARAVNNRLRKASAGK